ncbi:hypothetical protein MMC26_004499 [Xylographa opegraphella]|nr:hypothetical protein [Xylographa opegraphella]
MHVSPLLVAFALAALSLAAAQVISRSSPYATDTQCQRIASEQSPLAPPAPTTTENSYPSAPPSTHNASPATILLPRQELPSPTTLATLPHDQHWERSKAVEWHRPGRESRTADGPVKEGRGSVVVAERAVGGEGARGKPVPGMPAQGELGWGFGKEGGEGRRV